MGQAPLFQPFVPPEEDETPELNEDTSRASVDNEDTQRDSDAMSCEGGSGEEDPPPLPPPPPPSTTASEGSVRDKIIPPEVYSPEAANLLKEWVIDRFRCRQHYPQSAISFHPVLFVVGQSGVGKRTLLYNILFAMLEDDIDLQTSRLDPEYSPYPCSVDKIPVPDDTAASSSSSGSGGSNAGSGNPAKKESLAVIDIKAALKVNTWSELEEILSRRVREDLPTLLIAPLNDLAGCRVEFCKYIERHWKRTKTRKKRAFSHRRAGRGGGGDTQLPPVLPAQWCIFLCNDLNDADQIRPLFSRTPAAYIHPPSKDVRAELLTQAFSRLVAQPLFHWNRHRWTDCDSDHIFRMAESLAGATPDEMDEFLRPAADALCRLIMLDSDYSGGHDPPRPDTPARTHTQALTTRKRNYGAQTLNMTEFFQSLLESVGTQYLCSQLSARAIDHYDQYKTFQARPLAKTPDTAPADERHESTNGSGGIKRARPLSFVSSAAPLSSSTTTTPESKGSATLACMTPQGPIFEFNNNNKSQKSPSDPQTEDIAEPTEKRTKLNPPVLFGNETMMFRFDD